MERFALPPPCDAGSGSGIIAHTNPEGTEVGNHLKIRQDNRSEVPGVLLEVLGVGAGVQ
jgi:hypothetical protein